VLVYEEIKKRSSRTAGFRKRWTKRFSEEFSTAGLRFAEPFIMLEKEGLITRQDGKGFTVKQSA